MELRHKGSALGWLWPLLAPLALLGVYTFVFVLVFPATWQGHQTTTRQFALNIYCGLIPFTFMAETLARAPGLLRENTAYLTKFLFPVEVLPVAAALAALFHAGVGFAALCGFQAVVAEPPGWQALWLAPLAASLGLYALGLSWALAALGFFLTDLKQAMAVVNLALMFLSPVFYPQSAFPAPYRYLLYANPATWPIERARDALFSGVSPGGWGFALHLAGGLATAWLGFALFARLRPEFSDAA